MKLKLSWNLAVQAVAMALQLFNAYGAILPAKYQALGAGILGGLQLIVGALAHYSNPDGTPAAQPYRSLSGPDLRGWIVFCLLVPFLGACASPFALAGMTPDQLREFARVNDAAATCVRAVSESGRGFIVATVHATKGVPSAATIRDSCEISFFSAPDVPDVPAQEK